MIKQYIPGLDLLRGLCALSIAAYHILSWSQLITFTAVGYYGVYIFFVLSGLSIHYQYEHKIKNLKDINSFIKKRFYRLFPLLFLTVAIQYVPHLLNLDLMRVSIISLTLSLLFGFAAPAISSAVTGGWSLGIEFVFYIVYPILLSFCLSRGQFIVLLISLFLLKFMFIEYVFYSSYTSYWVTLFTNPLSFFFYFAAGCFLAELYSKFQKFSNNKIVLFLLFPLFLLLFIPINYTDKNVLVGIKGSMFTCLTVLIVLLYALYVPQLSIIKRICKFLGDISYGVYLLHPLIWNFFYKTRLWEEHPVRRCLVIILITSIIAIIIKKFYEEPAINRLNKETRR